MDYIKHFNQQSEKYLCYRPDYPEALFDFLCTHVDENSYAWDCGTGNGQAALALAKRFQRVVASDINLGQLTAAPHKGNIDFVCCLAEKTPLADHSIELITIAQALHWFKFEEFYAEVRRVSRPSAMIAAWCYSLGGINTDLDSIIHTLYNDILGCQYWPKERDYIDEKFETIPFPFKKMNTPEFRIRKKLDFPSFIGYLQTWSAVKEYELRMHKNPLDIVIPQLQSAWGKPELQHEMHWPVHMLLGRVH